MADKWELPVAFYFQVHIGSQKYAFKEVAGLSAEMEGEAIQEGGVNSYVHVLPKKMKHANLVLESALCPVSQEEVKWIKNILDGNFEMLINTQPILLNLLNSGGTPVYSWLCENAYPVKWQVETLDAEENVILIETIEFAYSTLRRL